MDEIADEYMDKLTERAYQIDAMGDLGESARKISNGEYESAISFITEVLETTKILSGVCEFGREMERSHDR